MAAGLPVVMTDVGLAGEVAKNGENSIIIPVADRTAFLDAVISFFRDAHIRENLLAGVARTRQEFLKETPESYGVKYREGFEMCV